MATIKLRVNGESIELTAREIREALEENVMLNQAMIALRNDQAKTFERAERWERRFFQLQALAQIIVKSRSWLKKIDEIRKSKP